MRIKKSYIFSDVLYEPHASDLMALEEIVNNLHPRYKALNIFSLGNDVSA